MLEARASKPRTYPILNLLKQIPSIHRTFTKVTKQPSIFLPVERFDLFHQSGQVWARVIIRRGVRDTDSVLRKPRNIKDFSNRLKQVRSNSDRELCFESDMVPGSGRGLETGLRILAKKLREVGIASILTSRGYRFYITSLSPGKRIPHLAASYAAMFYLGSITRYKPYDFDKIISGAYRWLVEEFIAMEPMQFIYTLGSILAGVDVVRPYADVS